jgi:hypothetical protein
VLPRIVTVAPPKLKRPPPKTVAELPAKVLPITVTVVVSCGPFARPPTFAELPAKVLSRTVAVPSLRRPPPSPPPASCPCAVPPRHRPREEDEKRIDPSLCLGVLSARTVDEPSPRTPTPNRRSPGMNRSTLAAALLFCGATASADPVSWPYNWVSSPTAISANAPGTGTIFLHHLPSSFLQAGVRTVAAPAPRVYFPRASPPASSSPNISPAL